ncbi:MAG: hypothetical protein KBD60_13885 [Sterolibacterium sp.]|nr:hypothetical protein [Sterolibacterium sp.]
MSQIFKTVSAACGHVSRAVLVKAARRLALSPESYRIADEVFLKGCRQASVARHVGVSRQRGMPCAGSCWKQSTTNFPLKGQPMEKLLLILIITVTLGGCASQQPLSMKNGGRTGTDQTPYRSGPIALICDDCNLQ